MAQSSTARTIAQVSSPTELTTPSGARAEVHGDALAIHAPDGALVAHYDAETGVLTLSGRAGVTISAKNGRIALDSDTLAITAKSARLTVGTWTLDAERIVERTVDAFRSVEGIAETQARRMRTIVERTLEFCSRRTTIASKEDTRIDGKRVLLG